MFLFRCQASCIAVTFAIAVMLQRDSNFLEKGGHFDVGKIIDFAYGQACRIFEGLPNEEVRTWKFLNEVLCTMDVCMPKSIEILTYKKKNNSTIKTHIIHFVMILCIV